MTTILHIDSSVRRTDNSVKSYNSISKSLASHFMKSWSSNDEPRVIYRDLTSNPPTFICQDWIAACFTPGEKRTNEQKSILSESDILIDEVVQADVIVISAPMYNYGMPAVLKAWIDLVVRINKTFSFDLARGDFPLKSLLSGKKLVLITSSGEFGFEVGGIREDMNHLAPHIKTVSKYLGVEGFYHIGSEYQEFADERHEKSLNKAYDSIDDLVNKLCSPAKV